MIGEVVAFENAAATKARDALFAAVTELHALVSIDPVLGASPVRIYFVFNPVAKDLVAAALDPPDRGRSRAAAAYALVAYDFPFAAHLLETGRLGISRERAREIICSSAELQEGALAQAADALGISAHPIPTFDAGALKTAFFPATQESVTHLFRLELARPASPAPLRRRFDAATS
jgi:hypothetical protein